ncbi:hypothetical protein BC332_16723 [Capsicum chinense]|nr:hypothetical protein BC332_16723 [Capsicum chinense]
MVSPKQPTGSILPIENKGPSSSSDDVPPFSKHPEVDDAPPSVKRRKGDDNVDTLEKKSMLPSENSKELHSTDQPEFEAGNVADQKVNDTADEKAEAAANEKIEAAADEKVDASADGKGDAAVDGGVFTPTPVGKYFLFFYFLSPSTLVTPYRRQGDEVVLSQAENNAYITIGVTFRCWDQCRKRKTVDYRKPGHIFEPRAMQSKPCISIYIEKGRGAVPLFSNFEAMMLEERWWITGLMPASTSEMSSKFAAVMKKLYAAIIDGQNIEVSFDDFPYYLSLLMVATGFVSICKAALLSLKMVRVVNYSIVSSGVGAGLAALRPVSEVNSTTYFL